MTLKKNIKITYQVLQSIFLKGLFTLLPLTLTLALLSFCFNLIKSWLQPVYDMEPESLRIVPHSEIFLVIAAIFVVGVIMQIFIVTHLVDTIENSILNRIPLLRQIYFGIKQLVNALNPNDQITFKHVVNVPFGATGTYALGFLTNYINPELAPNKDIRYVSVFVPTTPNPTTGFYLVVPESDCRILNITRQEAMTVIISGGILQPETNISQ
ncbi:MAG: DUF502 domain-containing protein [Candidatus Babeliaceae bacterium]|nr:DUF502 domain-containing protein [Candidatus Babeliaceae bacterium]